MSARASFVWGDEARVRVADEDELTARARRSASVGAYLVERRGGVKAPGGEWAPGSGCWHVVSSHTSPIAAEAALAKLKRKIAKEASC